MTERKGTGVGFPLIPDDRVPVLNLLHLWLPITGTHRVMMRDPLAKVGIIRVGQFDVVGLTLAVDGHTPHSSAQARYSAWTRS